MIPQKSRIFTVFLVGWMLLTLSACDRYPRDPRDALARIEHTRQLRVGVSLSDPWVTGQPGSEPSGIEAQLVRQLADDLQVQIQWQWGSAQEHFQALRTHQLDLAIGGFTRDNPWSKHVGFTYPYHTSETGKHAIAIPKGENALLMRVESFLMSQATPARIHPLQEASQP